MGGQKNGRKEVVDRIASAGEFLENVSTCTDLFLWYGRIGPGEEKTCYGHIFFADWDLPEFSRRAEALTEKWHACEKRKP